MIVFQGETSQKNVCKKCTYENAPSSLACEMCETALVAAPTVPKHVKSEVRRNIYPHTNSNDYKLLITTSDFILWKRKLYLAIFQPTILSHGDRILSEEDAQQQYDNIISLSRYNLN